MIAEDYATFEVREPVLILLHPLSRRSAGTLLTPLLESRRQHQSEGKSSNVIVSAVAPPSQCLTRNPLLPGLRMLRMLGQPGLVLLVRLLQLTRRLGEVVCSSRVASRLRLGRYRLC